MLSSLDTKYINEVDPIQQIFSEEYYYKLAFDVEIHYYSYLITSKFGCLKDIDILKNSISNSTHEFDYNRFREIESKTKHDIKSIELLVIEYLRDNYKLEEKYLGMVHFGLTSQDIVSTVRTIQVILANTIITNKLSDLSVIHIGKSNIKEKFIGRTHGQKAIFTSFDEQLTSFDERICYEDSKLNKEIVVKFGGAINNFLSLRLIDEDSFPFLFRNFIKSFFKEQYKCECKVTTSVSQTDNYRFIITQFQALQNISNILRDFCSDFWIYTMMEYLILPIDKDQVGSSTMPSKVNPILLENAEGNCKMSEGIAKIFIDNLNASRLQRDLSDITMVRNIGLVYGHLYLAIINITKFIKTVDINLDRCKFDQENSYQSFSEFIQLFLKFHGYNDSYSTIKELTRTGKDIDLKGIEEIISDLKIEEGLKDEIIKKITSIF